MLQDRREGGGVVGDPKITFLSAPLSQSTICLIKL